MAELKSEGAPLTPEQQAAYDDLYPSALQPQAASVPTEGVVTVRVSSDCICVVSGNGAEGCGLCNETGVRHVVVDEEDIADAISDSIDMDWNARDGARAVIRLLRESAAVASPSLGTKSQSDGVNP